APKHDDQALGHVFASVIAYAFYNSRDAGVSHCKSLACHSVEERFAACGSVQYNISDQNVFLGQEGGSLRRIHDHSATREALAHVVVRIAFERQRNPLGEKCSEALASRTGEMKTDGVVGQSLRSIALCNLAAQHC